MMKKTFRNRERQNKRLVRMLIVLILAFQVSYLPRGVIMLIYEFSPETTANPDFLYVELITLAMYYLKHVINPIILSAMSKDFRSGCMCHLLRQPLFDKLPSQHTDTNIKNVQSIYSRTNTL